MQLINNILNEYLIKHRHIYDIIIIYVQEINYYKFPFAFNVYLQLECLINTE